MSQNLTVSFADIANFVQSVLNTLLVKVLKLVNFETGTRFPLQNVCVTTGDLIKPYNGGVRFIVAIT